MAKYLADGFEDDSVHESGNDETKNDDCATTKLRTVLRTRAEDSVL